MNKATKGLWNVSGGCVSCEDFTIIVSKANANLIASAPELLVVLEKLTYRLTELNSMGKLNKLGLDKLIRESFEVTEKARGA